MTSRQNVRQVTKMLNNHFTSLESTRGPTFSGQFSGQTPMIFRSFRSFHSNTYVFPCCSIAVRAWASNMLLSCFQQFYSLRYWESRPSYLEMDH